jgi:hypothetical protein
MCLLKLYRKYFVPAVLLELKRSLEENIRKDIAKQNDIYIYRIFILSYSNDFGECCSDITDSMSDINLQTI